MEKTLEELKEAAEHAQDEVYEVIGEYYAGICTLEELLSYMKQYLPEVLELRLAYENRK